MLHALLAVATLAAPPTTATAQPAPAGQLNGGPMGSPYAMPQVPPEAQAKFAELKTIGEHLKEVRDQAVKSPAILKQMEAFRSAVEAKMVKDDPSLAPKVARFRALEGQLDPLVAANDFEKAQPLLVELRGLAQELSPAQQKAMSDETVAKRGKGLQASLEAEMQRIEPKMGEMIARAEVLRNELRQVMGAPPPGAGPGMPGSPRR